MSLVVLVHRFCIFGGKWNQNNNNKFIPETIERLNMHADLKGTTDLNTCPV